MRNFFRSQRALEQARLERIPLNEFHHQIWASFMLEAGFEVGVFAKRGMQGFERHITIQRGMITLIDRGHAALAELFHDPVWADVFTDIERHVRAPVTKLASLYCFLNESLDSVDIFSPYCNALDPEQKIGGRWPRPPIGVQTSIRFARLPRPAVPCLPGTPARPRRRSRRASFAWQRPLF